MQHICKPRFPRQSVSHERIWACTIMPHTNQRPYIFIISVRWIIVWMYVGPCTQSYVAYMQQTFRLKLFSILKARTKHAFRVRILL